MSDVDVNALSEAPAPAATPASESTHAGSRVGGGPVMRTCLPRTTGQMSGTSRAAPDPTADTAAISAELGVDSEDSPVGSAAAPPAPPPSLAAPRWSPKGSSDGGDGGNLPAGLRSELEVATGASLGDVAINAGPLGARTADAHSARAVAEGH
ncbi:MAG: DUF4157 domain-containing protein, partial [Kofleriaceae bacterium]